MFVTEGQSKRCVAVQFDYQLSKNTAILLKLINLNNSTSTLVSHLTKVTRTGKRSKSYDA